MSELIQSNTVEAYFDAQDQRTKLVLLELKKYILEVAPNAEELLNYNIAAYALVTGGKSEAQIMIAANKLSVGFIRNPP